MLDPAVHEELRRELGLDLPLPLQYLDWTWRAVRFDFGLSLWTRQAVGAEIANRLPVTAELALLSFVIVVGLGFPAGIASAAMRDSPVDYAIRTAAIVGLAVPSFWLGLVILLLLVGTFRWMPSMTPIALTADPKENLLQFIWPAIAVGYHQFAITARLVRASVLEVLEDDFIRTARAKGLPPRVVLLRHALRNALGPVLANLGLVVAYLLTGTVVIETVFNLPGVGRYVVDAIGHRDYPSVQAVLFLSALAVVAINVAVDLLHAAIDPRVGRV